MSNLTPKPTRMLRRYTGKSSDATAATISMILAAAGSNAPHVSCLTGRPFGFRVVANNPQYWLVPWREPWEGLQSAIRSIGVKDFRVRSGGDAALIVDEGLQWASEGPVAIGPLDPATLWNRLESHYYGGTAHWLVILDQQDEFIVVHDPEGCPGRLVHRTDIENALNRTPSENGILQITKTIASTVDVALILESCIIDGITLRSTHCHSTEFGGQGIQQLVDSLRERSLTAAECASLSYGLPVLCTSRYLVAAMLTELARTIPSWQRISILAANHADSICRTTALTNRARSEGRDTVVIDGLKKLAEVEAELDTILADIPCS